MISKNIIFLPLVTLLLILGHSVAISLTESVFEENYADTPCGAVITGDTGIIEYKVNETYLPREKCVWTVRTPSSSQIKFTKEFSNFGEPESYLTIHTFRYTGSAGDGILGQTNRTQVLYLNGTVGVIVFSTSAFSSNNGTGFRLTFEGLGSPDNGVQTGSDLILAGNYGSTLHPPVGSDGIRPGNYSNNELSTFVVSWNFTRNTVIGGTNKVRIQFPEAEIARCFETCTCDSIWLYEVIGSQLSRIHKYCENGPSGPYGAHDLLIAVFVTDSNNVAAGFQLYWELYE